MSFVLYLIWIWIWKMEKNLFCEEIKPIFYKTDIERNKNWETLLPSSNFFRT